MRTGNVFGIALLVLGLYDMVAGIAGGIKGRIYVSAKNYTNRYTEESLLQFARPLGLANALLGLAISLGALYNLRDMEALSFMKAIEPKYFWGIMLALVLIALVILIIFQKKLVKK